MSSSSLSPHYAEQPGLFRRMHDFLHAREVPFGTAAVRILLPWALVGCMAPRWLHTREMFSSDGAATPLWESYGTVDMLPIPSGAISVALHSLLLFSLLAMSVGWRTRIACVLSFVLYTYLNLLDALSTITKYSCIASHVLLLLSFSRCGLVWSVDAWLARRRLQRSPGSAPQPDLTDCAAPRRMIQLVVGMVYFGAAVTKMQTAAFFSGDQLGSWMITNVNFGHPLGEVFALQPALLVSMAYITVVWEVLFLFTAWRGTGRLIMLATGVTFHLMTTLTLGLIIFPAVSISSYFAFMNEDDVRRFSAFARRLRRRIGWFGRRGAALSFGPQAPRLAAIPSAILFATAALASMAGGVELERRLDPYGTRRAEGRHQLRELDTEWVYQAMQPEQRLRDEDKFAGVEIGTRLVGGTVVNRKDTFRQNEQMIVQCLLTPPHEDMWVEVNLHDADDHVLNRSGKAVERESLRSNFKYRLSSALEPGEYFLVLRAGGREVSRRMITLLPGDRPYEADAEVPVTASAN